MFQTARDDAQCWGEGYFSHDDDDDDGDDDDDDDKLQKMMHIVGGKGKNDFVHDQPVSGPLATL